MLDKKAAIRYIACALSAMAVLTGATFLPQSEDAKAVGAPDAVTARAAAPYTIVQTQPKSGDTRQADSQYAQNTGSYTAVADIRISGLAESDEAVTAGVQTVQADFAAADMGIQAKAGDSFEGVDDTGSGNGQALPSINVPDNDQQEQTDQTDQTGQNEQADQDEEGEDTPGTEPEANTLPFAPQNTIGGGVILEKWSVMKDVIVKWKKDITYEVIDVRTGISYTVYRMGGSEHCDAETMTPEDTAAMKQTFGGKWSGDRRPVWMVIDNKYYAASVMGSPHGQDTISGNDMSGQFCIHFLGSKMHNPNRVDERHQAAVQEAYAKGNGVAQYIAPPQPPRQQNPWEVITPEMGILP